ncbi:FlaD/FlaE family flagellar protein [Halorarum halobium]|uniref:FlaD/FlaE family flagellar protein n=1 Tax=Halorarum halobium TaxID=3075121 RepID=UPI0028A79F7A|nr:FlaD/FlaE family flagellar protein [Halobaculum sp. XH14]
MGLLTALSGAGAGFAGVELGLLASFGLVGASLLDRFRDDDEPTEDAEDDDPLLDDGGAFGGDADGDGDDLGDLGGMDDWDDDDPFGGDEEEDATAELEKRLEDLENEVASLSSTVNTVRSENEEISGQVDDMGEDVRSLLDIYEMVTRGINPFVDDVQTGGMSGDELGGEGSFGLFDDDADEEDPEAEELDEDLANAEAEGFFDEELVDGEEDEDDEDLDELDDEEDDEDDDLDNETMASDNGGGKSFSELKDEYESGDAEWAGGEEAEAPIDGADDAGDEFPLDEMDEDPVEDALDEEPASTAAPTDPTPAENGDGGFEFVEDGDLSEGPQKPYLTSLPGDYVGDLMVMEWLEFLVEESSTTDAVRAVNYYERVDWVDAEVANQLKSFLSGFGDIDRNLMDRPGTSELDLDHHTQSLKYIMQLTNATAESVVIDRWPQLSGGLHGPQR